MLRTVTGAFEAARRGRPAVFGPNRTHNAQKARPANRALAGAVVATIIGCVPAAAQGVPLEHLIPGDTVVVVPGAGYGASAVRGWLMGNGYRDLWTTPLRVEVASLDRLGGGLIPMRIGGGMTTATLHLRGGDGRRYVFRTVDKRAGRGLAAELQGTIYESLLQDQISAFHPSGALIVAELLEAVGVLHTTPRLYVVPDDPRLGEFRKMFAGTLVLFEERPDDGENPNVRFAGARRVVNSEQMLIRLRESPRHRVAEREYLVARLVDLLVGDRDRSLNNWLWAQFRDGELVRWRAIPRDRDQAFIRLDGLLKQQLRVYESRLVAFGPRTSNVRGLTRNAWDLDRTILVALSRDDWDSAVSFVQERLTDSVIDRATRAMPPEHVALVGPDLAAALRARVADLPRAGGVFYRLVNRFADVSGTDEPELADLTRQTDGTVLVTLRSSDVSEPFFRRRFSPAETREVRVYLYDGRDRVRVDGQGPSRIAVRVMGGEGADTLLDSTRTGTRVALYDGGARTHFSTAPRTAVRRRAVERPRMWGERAGLPPDWGGRWDPYPKVGVRGDVGALIGGRVVLTRYAFGKRPYGHRAYVDAEYATGVGRMRGEYSQRWRLSPEVETRLRLAGSGFEVIRFHGFGNNTPAARPTGFYQVIHDAYSVHGSAAWTPSGRWRLATRVIVRQSVTDTTNAATFVATTRPYGSGRFSQFGLALGFSYDSRNRPIGATRGAHITGTGTVYPAVADVVEPIAIAEGTAAAHVSSDRRGRVVLAGRVGAKKVWGRIPFHHAAFLGGSQDLRGFRKQRFAGDASLYANAEVRVLLGRVDFLFPTDIGTVLTRDWGRVFVAGDSPGGWHSSYGGGLWLAPIDRAYTASAVLARSENFTGLHLRSGFLF